MSSSTPASPTTSPTPASKYQSETVLSVHHWTDRLFSFTTTRNSGLRFKNGQFIMIGLALDDGRPLMRAYSMASANYEEFFEFFSIKVQDGPLTSRLQKIQIGDSILVGSKPTGTLIADHLFPGKHLYLIGTGTGLAPFISVIKDPEVYDQFDKIILVHGCREVADLAYYQMITEELPSNEFFGDMVREKLLYYPTVTREEFRNQGRVTDLITSGKLMTDLGLPSLSAETDRVMLCGSPSMLKDTVAILEQNGLIEAKQGDLGHYVIERAFVER